MGLVPSMPMTRGQESFTGAWLAAGGLERPRAQSCAFGDASLVPDCPRYRPVRSLGRGGSGAVWLVHDVVLDREVAMKVLIAEVGESPDVRARFLYEARLAGSLRHVGVVPVYDAGMLADGRCFFTMQYIAGPTLAEAIDARNSRQYDALGQRTLLTGLARICRTVAHAHAHGTSHRDLKPANVLIGADGEAWLADWGLSGPSDQGLPPSPAAGGGQMLSGTLHYMAPEQLCGDGRHLGPLSDVYSLGVCLFEILTGTTPHHGASVLSLMFQIRNVDAPDPRSVAPQARISPELAALCALTLSREPSHRVLTAAALADRLEKHLKADGSSDIVRRAL